MSHTHTSQTSSPHSFTYIDYHKLRAFSVTTFTKCHFSTRENELMNPMASLKHCLPYDSARRRASVLLLLCILFSFLSQTHGSSPSPAPTPAPTEGIPESLLLHEWYGDAELVFDYATDRCDHNDFANTPPRAFKENDGMISMIFGSSVNSTYKARGERIDELSRECAQNLYGGGYSATFGDFTGLDVVAAVGVEGTTLFALVEVRWRPQPMAVGYCDSCIYSSVALATSKDGGATFQRQGDVIARPRDTLTALMIPSPKSTVGYGRVSNLLVLDDYTYFLVHAYAYDWQQKGTCVVRSATPLDDESWRAYDVTTGNYTADLRSEPCTPVPGLHSASSSWTLNRDIGLLFVLDTHCYLSFCFPTVWQISLDEFPIPHTQLILSYFGNNSRVTGYGANLGDIWVPGNESFALAANERIDFRFSMIDVGSTDRNFGVSTFTPWVYWLSRLPDPGTVTSTVPLEGDVRDADVRVYRRRVRIWHSLTQGKQLARFSLPLTRTILSTMPGGIFRLDDTSVFNHEVRGDELSSFVSVAAGTVASAPSSLHIYAPDAQAALNVADNRAFGDGGDLNALSINSSLTVIAAVRIDSLYADDTLIVGKGRASPLVINYAMYVLGTAHADAGHFCFRFQRADSSVAEFIFPKVRLDDQRFHMLSVMVDAVKREVRLMIDSATRYWVQVNGAEWLGARATNAVPLKIGKFFDGYLDSVVIYGEAIGFLDTLAHIIRIDSVDVCSGYDEEGDGDVDTGFECALGTYLVDFVNVRNETCGADSCVQVAQSECQPVICEWKVLSVCDTACAANHTDSSSAPTTSRALDTTPGASTSATQTSALAVAMTTDASGADTTVAIVGALLGVLLALAALVLICVMLRRRRQRRAKLHKRASTAMHGNRTLTGSRSRRHSRNVQASRLQSRHASRVYASVPLGAMTAPSESEPGYSSIPNVSNATSSSGGDYEVGRLGIYSDNAFSLSSDSSAAMPSSQYNVLPKQQRMQDGYVIGDLSRTSHLNEYSQT